ncbi:MULTISPECIES: gp53-like domain-containing protein [unclassified Variovorax]|uniref:gp53-like domain-containing protein n=1 Tax=unclassified Variovorax TaxID=663243 RepID=UPI003F48EF72
MFGIDDATAVAVMPTPEAAGTPGFFTEGNPGLGQAATYVRASFLNGMQQELLNILTAAGITPSKTVYNQLLAAMRSNALIYATDTGAANAAVLTYAPAVTALVDGMVLWFKAKAANTGATTLNVNGLGATPVVGGAQTALQGGEIVANGRCQVIYSATLAAFVLIECTGAALQVAAGAQTGHAVNLGQFAGTKTQNGYQKLPGGLILEWGLYSNPGGIQNAGIVLPLAFPTAILIAQLTTFNATTSANGGSVYSLALSGFNAALNGAYSFYWFAIGY